MGAILIVGLESLGLWVVAYLYFAAACNVWLLCPSKVQMQGSPAKVEADLKMHRELVKTAQQKQHLWTRKQMKEIGGFSQSSQL